VHQAQQSSNNRVSISCRSRPCVAADYAISATAPSQILGGPRPSDSVQLMYKTCHLVTRAMTSVMTSNATVSERTATRHDRLLVVMSLSFHVLEVSRLARVMNQLLVWSVVLWRPTNRISGWPMARLAQPTQGIGHYPG